MPAGGGPGQPPRHRVQRGRTAEARWADARNAVLVACALPARPLLELGKTVAAGSVHVGHGAFSRDALRPRGRRPDRAPRKTGPGKDRLCTGWPHVLTGAWLASGRLVARNRFGTRGPRPSVSCRGGPRSGGAECIRVHGRLSARRQDAPPRAVPGGPPLL